MRVLVRVIKILHVKLNSYMMPVLIKSFKRSFQVKMPIVLN